MNDMYIVGNACRCNALDKIGDKSSEEQRRKYFTEVDTDQSDGVDFEEFLEVRHFHINFVYIYAHLNNY